MASDNDARDRSGRRLRGWRAAVALTLAIAVPLGIAGGLWLASAQHALLPGMQGCTYVRERSAQISCYTRTFDDLRQDHGIQRALRDVDQRARTSLTLGSDCHVAWHPVGERAGADDARDGTGYDNITAATTCQQGYAHGYTIGYMGERAPTQAELAKFVESDCRASSNVPGLLNCVHAYGHVIARRYDGDVVPAVTACGRIDYGSLPGVDAPSLVPGAEPPLLAAARHQCLYGLYMEVSLLQLSDGDRVRDNCADAPTQPAMVACYAYLPSRVNDITGDLQTAAGSCSRYAPAGEPRTWCVRMFSMGLPEAKRCTYLPAASQQRACRAIIDLRENADEIERLTAGATDTLDAELKIAPEPGVTPPASGPGDAAPTIPPRS